MAQVRGSLGITNRSDIFVYAGPGTELVDTVCSSLESALGTIYNVAKITAYLLQDTAWMTSAKLLVIPGGRDMPYTKDISDVALQNIREFIASGGSYLGLCAGAYFSCERLIFGVGTSNEIVEERHLKLFPGTAIGSVFPFEYAPGKTTRMVRLTGIGDRLQIGNDSDCRVYFNGGCEFVYDADVAESGFESLASYAEFPTEKVAIVYKKGVGSGGNVLLSGVHPELDVSYLPKENYTPEQWDEMNAYSAIQKKLYISLLSLLLKEI